MKPWTYNYGAESVNYTITYAHTFIERCYILKPIYPTYLVLSGIWTLVLVIWWWLTFIKFKRQALYLQKTLTIIPVCKLLECLIIGLFLNACPWISI